jgi:hypothetical protein
MAADEKTTGSNPQKTRADAIRRFRDKRNESLKNPGAPAPTAPAAPEEDQKPADRSPNYVEFIDRKMRERKKAGSTD